MKDESVAFIADFYLHPSAFILHTCLSGRRSQVVRQRSAKPLFIGSIPIAASNLLNNLRAAESITEK
jgi:hypothetical protein